MFSCYPKNMPFKYTGNKKTAYGSKLIVYLISGFSIPFVAAWYQLYVHASIRLYTVLNTRYFQEEISFGMILLATS